MDINKLITEVNADYMPLKLKSKTAGANLTDAEAETLFNSVRNWNSSRF